MAASTKDLRAKRANVIKSSRELVDKIDAEKRDWTADENAQWDRFNADIDRLGTEIERIDKLEKYEASLKEVSNDPSHLRHAGPSAVAAPPDDDEADEKSPLPVNEARALAIQGWFLGQSRSRSNKAAITEKHRQAARQCKVNLHAKRLKLNLLPSAEFNRVRDEVRFAWDPERQRYNALSSLQGAAGGVTVPQGFVYDLERAQLAFGYMQQVAETLRTDMANPMPWPMVKDTTNKGRLLTQSGAVLNDASLTSEPTWSAMVLYAYKFTSDEILVPYELLRDSAFDLASVLASMLGERLGRVKNDYYTTGTGAAQPTGMMTKSVLGKTSATATAIKFDEVIDLEHSVDPAYRSNPGVGYMCHDGIVQYLRKLKDGEGRYLWQASANAGEPDRLNNRRLTRNQSMQATVATGTKTLVFGDLSKVKIREVGSVRLYRLTERYRDNDQDAFLAFCEADSNVLDAGGNPIKHLLQA